MGIERGRMRKEPDNQSSGKATAKIARKTAAAASTFQRGDEDPYDSDSDPAYREICLSDLGGNMTTPSTQFHMDLEAIMKESVLILESTKASDDGALLHLGEQTTTPIAQAMLGATAVGCIPISATVSNDRACNNKFVIHYIVTTKGRRTLHSQYLLVLGWTATHLRPPNHV